MVQRWAFLVGINHYIDPSISTLQFCVNDVLALEKVLKQVSYEVICLHSELDRDSPLYPTRDNVEAQLKHLCDNLQREDLLWAHFACHGTLVEKQDKKEPVLITADTRWNLLQTRAISLREVEQYMKDSHARKLVLTLDACHSGVEMGRGLTDREFIHNVYELAEGFALIAASTAQQLAFEWREKQHGVFTYHLLEGITGKGDIAGKNFVTVDDLKLYVLDGLRRWNIKEGRTQEPTARTEGLGDMILADYRDNPKLREILVKPSQQALLLTAHSKSRYDSTTSRANNIQKQMLEEELATTS